MPVDKRVYFKEHHGKQVLHIDLRGAQRDGQLAVLESCAAAVANLPENSARLLVLAEDGFDFYPEVATKARSVMAESMPKVMRSALLGLEGIVKVAFDTYYQGARLMGHEVDEHGRHFKSDDLNAALDWLVQD